jgi:hypothetical protein
VAKAAVSVKSMTARDWYRRGRYDAEVEAEAQEDYRILEDLLAREADALIQIHGDA